MGSFFASTIEAFSGATAQVKAGVIAAACGVFGVVCGFVLYVVFTHMFEHGDVTAKAVGVAVGLFVSMAVAWTGERLWETIDSGEFKLGGHTRRAFVAGLSLVIVFELSASAFEDFARELTGDFDGIKRIAGAIAGRETSQADAPISQDEAAALLVRFRKEASERATFGQPAASTPATRIYDLMTFRDRLELFSRELRPSDADLAKLLEGYTGIMNSGLNGIQTGPCHARLRILTLEDLQAHRDVHTQPLQQDLDACRQHLLSLSDDQRRLHLINLMQRVIGRYDLYDASSFKSVATGTETKLEKRQIEALSKQREQCDAIRASTPAARSMLCADAARNGTASPGSGKLIAPSDMRVLNRDLLAASFPGIIRPLPVLWWDMGLMMLMWCTSAMVVGAYLAYLTRPEMGGNSLKAFGMRIFTAFGALWVAGLIAAGVLVLVRVPPYLWQLMVDPHSSMLVHVPGILNAIPGMVSLLASGDLLGFSIPGWVTLPIMFISAFTIFARTRESSDDGIGNFAGLALLGLVVAAVAPVLDGLVGVVLLLVGAWFVPTLGLATLAPYLRPGRDLPQWWGVVALLGGIAVIFWALIALYSTDFTYFAFIVCAAGAAVLTGANILWRVPTTEAWPLLAITVGLSLVGLSSAFQQLTFAGALKHLHPVAHTELPHGVKLMPRGEEDLVSYLTVLVPPSRDADLPESFRAEPIQDDVSASLHLELALAGSVGFWLTLAMMVGWALNQGPRKPEDDVAAAGDPAHRSDAAAR